MTTSLLKKIKQQILACFMWGMITDVLPDTMGVTSRC